MALTVGMIGLGIMGTGMSSNILKAGHAMVGHDIDPARVKIFTANGGRAMTSNAAVGHAADIVFTSMPNAAALIAVSEGAGSLTEADNAGLVVFETSTLPIAAKERARDALAKVGIILLDCPLSGAGKQAEAGELSLMASGEMAGYDKATEIFDSFCKVHRYVGEFGTGMKLKMIINMLISIHCAGFAEAIALARKSGVDLDLMFDAVTAGAGNSRVVEYRGPLMINRKFADPDWKTVNLPIQVKDNGVIADWISSLHVPTPTFNSSTPYYEAGMSMGFLEEDPGAIVKVVELISGIEVDD